MRTDRFDYELPEDLIAQKPMEPRDSCRMMVLRRGDSAGVGALEHAIFFDLMRFLKKGDVLVFNRSKVIPARILFEHKGREVEIFLTREAARDGKRCEWLALVRPGRFFKVGEVFLLEDEVKVEVMEVCDDGQRLLRFSVGSDELRGFLERVGRAPFPPYIQKPEATLADYQTVYAREEGSVAAPTAGLHFTDELLVKLEEAGVQREFVVLHVGLGTFQPVKTENIEDHVMHYESFELDPATAGRLTAAKKEGRRIIAVGTTAVRVLESSFDGGAGDAKGKGGGGIFRAGSGETDIFIYPGYEWRCVDGLITNFHLPKSTLLMLVSAFAGEEAVRSAYAEAIREKYRFYSFGDAMLIL